MKTMLKRLLPMLLTLILCVDLLYVPIEAADEDTVDLETENVLSDITQELVEEENEAENIVEKEQTVISETDENETKEKEKRYIRDTDISNENLMQEEPTSGQEEPIAEISDNTDLQTDNSAIDSGSKSPNESDVLSENINTGSELLNIYGDARELENQVIELTPLETFKAGSIWYDHQFETDKTFEVSFSYWAGGGRDDSFGGADGFILNLSATLGVGESGENQGFIGGDAYGVEFDSYPQNRNDPDGKHIAIIKGSSANHLEYCLDDRVDDSKWHDVRVTYAENILMVYLDEEQVLTCNDVILPERVYIGISAGTGSGKNQHLVKNLVANDTVITSVIVPPILQGTADGHKKVKLTWTYDGKIDFVKNFILYRSENESDFSYVQSISPDKNEYIDVLEFTGNEKKYYYKLEVYDIYDQKKSSEIISVIAISEDTENPVPSIYPNQITYAELNEPFSFSAAASTDNDIIADYNWDFGDGSYGSGVVVSHVYDSVGDYTVTLTLTDESGNSEKTSVNLTVVDLSGEDSKYTKLMLNICDAASLEVIKNAQITITYEEAMDIWNVDENGLFTCIIPNGSYNVSVCADGYIIRTVKIIAGGGTIEKTVGLSKGSILIGELTSTELTYEEIIEAGIDPKADGNEHVYEFKAVLKFQAGIKEYEFPYAIFKNENQEIVGSSGGGYYTVSGDDRDYSNDLRIGIFPISEHFALIVYGEAHWLKEMYKVELLVTNTSNTDTLEQVSAELELPEGLSLANIVDGKQSLKQDLGTIGYSGNTKATWFIRGDKEGEYNLTAKVHAVSMPFSENIEQIFTTTSPLKVYAGSALHMTITADDVAYRGQEYNVKFRLENVSDKSIYNLSFGIIGSDQYKVIGFGDNEAWLPITEPTDYGEEWTKKIDELAPGGYIELELSTTIWFNSALELVKLTQLGTFVDVAYYLTDVSIVALESNTTTIPYDIVINRTERDYFVDKVANELLKKLYGDIIPSGSLGGTIIELIGEELELSSSMIKGAKGILSLQQGETDHKLVVSIDDGLGNRDSIYNDVLRITTGSDTQAIIDTVNGTKLKVEFGEISIQAKAPGSTKLKIGIENSLGKIEREYVIDVIVDDKEIKNTLKLTPGESEEKFSIDEDTFSQTIEQVRAEESSIYNANPFLWFDSIIELDTITKNVKTEYSVEITSEQLEEILNQTATTNIEMMGEIAKLNFNREALLKVAEEAGEKYIITSRLLSDEEAKKLGSTDSTYQFEIQAGDSNINSFGEGVVCVTIPYVLDNDSTAKDVIVEHIKDDGTVEELEAEYNSDSQTVSFMTDSFSYFRICSNEESLEHTHTPENAIKENEIPATCISDGSYDSVVYCSKCGEELSRETKKIPATGHTWDNGIVTKEATEEEEGTITYTCIICNEIEIKTIPKLSHIHEYNKIITEPTCTEKGFTTYICACGDSYVEDYIEATGHTYTYTDNQDGTHTKTCIAGDDTAVEKHIYADGVCACGVKEKSEIDETHVHDYEKPVFRWSDDYSTCNATFTCKSNDDTQTVNCIVNKEIVESTSSKDDKIIYTATVEFNGQIYSDTQTIVIPSEDSVAPDYDHHNGWKNLINTLNSWKNWLNNQFDRWFGKEEPDISNGSVISKFNPWNWIQDVLGFQK